ncbi:hypothetical protein ACJX0J_017543, partial [Zea mays]
ILYQKMETVLTLLFLIIFYFDWCFVWGFFPFVGFTCQFQIFLIGLQLVANDSLIKVTFFFLAWCLFILKVSISVEYDLDWKGIQISVHFTKLYFIPFLKRCTPFW